MNALCKWFYCEWKIISLFLTAGIGMDSCVIPLRHGGLSLVQTTDFFYPLVEDPYMMVSGILLKFRKSYHAPHKKMSNSCPFFYRDELPVQMCWVICTLWASQSVTTCLCFSASVRRWMRRCARLSASCCCIFFGFTF